MAKKYSRNQLTGILLLVAAVLLAVPFGLDVLGILIVIGVGIYSLIKG